MLYELRRYNIKLLQLYKRQNVSKATCIMLTGVQHQEILDREEKELHYSSIGDCYKCLPAVEGVEL